MIFNESRTIPNTPLALYDEMTTLNPLKITQTQNLKKKNPSHYFIQIRIDLNPIFNPLTPKTISPKHIDHRTTLTFTKNCSHSNCSTKVPKDCLIRKLQILKLLYCLEGLNGLRDSTQT